MRLPDPTDGVLAHPCGTPPTLTRCRIAKARRARSGNMNGGLPGGLWPVMIPL
jgi:hypothetical protein